MNIITMIVDRCHLDDTFRQVIRSVVGSMREGHKTFRSLPKPDRRRLMEQAITRHRQNRFTYRMVADAEFPLFSGSRSNPHAGLLFDDWRKDRRAVAAAERGADRVRWVEVGLLAEDQNPSGITDENLYKKPV